MRKSPSNFKDLTGQKFGRLTVVVRHGSNLKGQAVWECACECGGKCYPLTHSLTTGNTKSCGCTRIESIRTLKYSHGHNTAGNPSPEYIVWGHMISRCRNEKAKDYKHYGGRGIKVCERWTHFENFLEDMGKRPSPKHSLDRIDVNSGYDPENCRWVTRDIQVRNRRSNNVYGYPGISFEKSSNKFRPHIGINGKCKFLGRYEKLEDAINARKQAEIKYWGEPS